MVTVPAADGQSAQVTALATAVGATLADWLGTVVAILLAVFFLFITVVYNFSFARLVSYPDSTRSSLGDGQGEQAHGAQRDLGADRHRVAVRVAGVHRVAVGRRRGAARGWWCTPPTTQEPGRCLGVSSRGSRRIEYPTTLVRGCPRDEHGLMFRVFLTHSAAQAVHALRSGRPRAQGGWVNGSCLVREGVPTDCRHAALKQRTTHRLRGTDDER